MVARLESSWFRAVLLKHGGTTVCHCGRVWEVEVGKSAMLHFMIIKHQMD